MRLDSLTMSSVQAKAEVKAASETKVAKWTADAVVAPVVGGHGGEAVEAAGEGAEALDRTVDQAGREDGEHEGHDDHRHDDRGGDRLAGRLGLFTERGHGLVARVEVDRVRGGRPEPDRADRLVARGERRLGRDVQDER